MLLHGHVSICFHSNTNYAKLTIETIILRLFGISLSIRQFPFIQLPITHELEQEQQGLNC